MTSVSIVFFQNSHFSSLTTHKGEVISNFADFHESISSRQADMLDIFHSSVSHSKSESWSDRIFFDDRTKDVAKILNKNRVDFPSCKQKQRMALSAVKVLTNLHRRLDRPKSPVSTLLSNVIQYGDRSSNLEKTKKDTNKQFHKVWVFLFSSIDSFRWEIPLKIRTCVWKRKTRWKLGINNVSKQKNSFLMRYVISYMLSKFAIP